MNPETPSMDLVVTQQEPGSVQRQVMNGNQGAVAVAVPRNIGNVMRQIEQLSELMGDKWKYRIPFGGQAVEGPTVGCALAVARSWGNCDVSCTEIEEHKDAWVFHASFVDLETGFRVVRPLRQRKSQKLSKKMDVDRQMDNAFLIGASKAMRNVVVNALRDVVDLALTKAEKRVADKVAENRTGALEFVRNKLEELQIQESRVAQFHGAKLEKLSDAKIAVIFKEIQAIEDGIVDAQDAFPSQAKPAAKLDVEKVGIKGKGETKKKEETKKQPEPQTDELDLT